MIFINIRLIKDFVNENSIDLYKVKVDMIVFK